MKRIEFTIPVEPRTKKNSQQIMMSGRGRRYIAQSNTYMRYVAETGYLLKKVKRENDIKEPITEPVHVKATFFRSTRKIVDLTNLQECLHDVLVGADILSDDSCRIIVSTDGSRVRYDKSNPRTEVVIEPIISWEDMRERERMIP